MSASAKNPGARGPAYTVVFMVTVAALFTGMVSAMHLSTRERISLNESLFRKRAVLSAAGLDVPRDAREVERLYTDSIEEIAPHEGGAATSFRVHAGGLVLAQSAPGLWGRIDAMVGFGPEGRTLTGIDFTYQNETPGLGGRIGEDWFRLQMRGKRPPLVGRPRGEAASAGEFDAITGATITTGAVRTIINDASRRALSPVPAPEGAN